MTAAPDEMATNLRNAVGFPATVARQYMREAADRIDSLTARIGELETQMAIWEKIARAGVEFNFSLSSDWASPRPEARQTLNLHAAFVASYMPHWPFADQSLSTSTPITERAEETPTKSDVRFYAMHRFDADLGSPLVSAFVEGAEYIITEREKE